MSTDDRNRVRAVIHEAVSDATRAVGSMPPVDTEEVLRQVDSPGRTVSWIVRLGAAAAVLVAATGVLLYVSSGPVSGEPDPTLPVPAHIVAMVDSLYADTDYVRDELADLLLSSGRDSGNAYLDDVWQTVISDITDG